MEDPVDFIGLIAIGAALAVPLVYGIWTLLGMTHKQFRPIFRERPSGDTTTEGNDQNSPPAGSQDPEQEQPRRQPW